MSDDTTDTTKRLHASRESWFMAAMTELAPYFEESGYPLPLDGSIRVSVGYGPTGSRKENKTVLAAALNKVRVDDGATEIWVSPEHATTAQALGSFVHVLIHAVLNQREEMAVLKVDGVEQPVMVWNRHDGLFAEIATRLGLEGRMSSAVAGPDLNMKLELITAALGEYPGARIDMSDIMVSMPVSPDGSPAPLDVAGSGPAKQTTRMYKRSCKNSECQTHSSSRGEGYTIRLSAKWIQYGSPECPACRETMS